MADPTPEPQLPPVDPAAAALEGDMQGPLYDRAHPEHERALQTVRDAYDVRERARPAALQTEPYGPPRQDAPTVEDEPLPQIHASANVGQYDPEVVAEWRTEWNTLGLGPEVQRNALNSLAVQSHGGPEAMTETALARWWDKFATFYGLTDQQRMAAAEWYRRRYFSAE